jgi:hypothetical protein
LAVVPIPFRREVAVVCLAGAVQRVEVAKLRERRADVRERFDRLVRRDAADERGERRDATARSARERTQRALVEARAGSGARDELVDLARRAGRRRCAAMRRGEGVQRFERGVQQLLLRNRRRVVVTLC